MDTKRQKLLLERDEFLKKAQDTIKELEQINDIEIKKLVADLRAEVTKIGVSDFEIRKALNKEFKPKAVEKPEIVVENSQETEKEKAKRLAEEAKNKK